MKHQLKKLFYLLSIIYVFIFIDITPLLIAETPVITIFSPADNTVTTKKQVLFKGKITNSESLTINKKEISLDSNGKFYEKINLEKLNDYNYFILTATSESGKTTKIAKKVFYKSINQTSTNKKQSQKPFIKLSSPENNLITNSPNILFSGKISGSNNLTINGNTIPISKDGFFTYNHTLKNTNDYETFYIIAYSDDQKNKTSISRKIFYRTKSSEGLSIMLSKPIDKYIATEPLVTSPKEIIAQTSSSEGLITSKSLGLYGSTHCPLI